MAESATLARPYAKAAFSVAKDNGKLADWSQLLSDAALITCDEKVQSLLSSPSLTVAQKSQSLAKVLADKVDPQFENFLSALADNKRLALLPDIASQFNWLKAQQEKSIAVEINSAQELSASLQSQLIAALTKKLEREVTLSATVDPALIGGALIRAGDTVIDGTVKGRLAKLAEAINA